MNVFERIIGAFRPTSSPPPAPKPEPSVDRKSHVYKVTEDGLSPTASSLDEYYQIQDLRHQANEVFGTMKYALELAAEDGSTLDSDPRQGHVKLEQHNFEAHPESGFQLAEGEVQIKGNDSTIETTRISDNWMAKNQSAVWDRENQSFILSLEGGDEPLIPRSPEHLVQQETSQSGRQDRANEILKAAQYWQEKAGLLDNSDRDIQGDSGVVVAPFTALEAEPVLADAFYSDQEGQHKFSAFDIEQSPSGTIVAGSLGQGRPFGARLSTIPNERGLGIVLERPEIGTTETVQWGVADGILHYEKYKKG